MSVFGVALALYRELGSRSAIFNVQLYFWLIIFVKFLSVKLFIPWLIRVLIMSSNSSSSICVCALHGNYLLIFMKLAMESSSSEVEGAAHSAFSATSWLPQLLGTGPRPIRCIDLPTTHFSWFYSDTLCDWYPVLEERGLISSVSFSQM